MPYTTLPEKAVGDPLVKEYFDTIKADLDDHENRLNQSETTGGTVFILNKEFNLAGLPDDDPFIFYYKATQDFSLSEVRAQIFDKGLITSGILAIDIQKSTDTNDTNFNSILNSDLAFDYSTDAAYAEKVASLNSSLTDFEAGNVLRIEVVSRPEYFGGKILIVIGAE